ncbi:DUF1310 family protein [Streptococcus parasanguinis]|uniref:DUF1310 family protein n=1 Tax=Streptococcus parasanguinis TaxID=1318 RepID=UPI00066BF4DA|nr:DUF1310 family protein [Streptococcus parasanguinis]
MKKSKFIVLVMILFGLSLGGCSFFNGQSAKKQEMIQIAESKQMKVAIEKYLKKQDPEALTPNGKIKTYRILKDKLKYNPMGGMILEVVINNDDTLIINMTVQEEDSGEYTVAASGMPKKLTRLIRGESDGH